MPERRGLVFVLIIVGCYALAIPENSLTLSAAAAVDKLTPDQMEAGSTTAAVSDNQGDRAPPPAPPSSVDDKLKIPAEDKFNQAAAPTQPAPQKEEYFDIIITIPTVRRFQKDGSPAPERYLAPLVDKMWYDMAEDQRPHVRFFILNSDKEPEKHEEANSLATHPGVTMFTKMMRKEEIVDQAISGYNDLEDGREVSKNWLSWVASENLDATFLFEKAKHQAPYLLFLEDDVMPTSQAMKKLNTYLKGFGKDDWLFLDLYTPNLNWGDGMTSFNNGDRYNFQCCTQAMLFRSDRIDGVSQYLIDHAREPIDDNLRNYMKDYTPNLGVYGVRPNLFEHVGAYSSNKEKSTGTVEHSSVEFVPLLL